MMDLGGYKIRYVALFCETSSDFFNIDNDEEKCWIQSTDTEAVYPKSEKFFLIGLHFYTGRAIHYSSKFI